MKILPLRKYEKTAIEPKIKYFYVNSGPRAVMVYS